MENKIYPGDFSNIEWKVIKQCISVHSTDRPREVDMRSVANAM